jgi:hypothetical protein
MSKSKDNGKPFHVIKVQAVGSAMKTIRARWRRQFTPGGNRGDHSLIAELIEVLEEHSKQEETVIKNLGTIEERFLTTRAVDARAFHQGLFWVAADRELDALPLLPELRKQIETVLMEKVPRPHADWAIRGITCTIRYDPS